MKHFLLLLSLLMTGLSLFTACEEYEETDPEYANWQARNAAYFQQQLSEAKAAIAQAQATHGEAWEEHCPWRVFRNYSPSPNPDVALKSTDSICVKIVERSGNVQVPIATDSVRVNFLGRLMPKLSGEDGTIFSHSGVSNRPEDIFSDALGAPAKFAVTGTVAGFATALQHMPLGDRWLIIIPQELGYKAQAIDKCPAYSTLIYEVQLKSIHPVGTSVE
ncbi:MAG: FKBP-type peptidyl-prolyl cis-trans isomerase [Bacteroidaceae bacterium]|nr:FKBP-type peptidyl-prolyl cis-trans isomerase [Bacteroidaceae bacterium]